MHCIAFISVHQLEVRESDIQTGKGIGMESQEEFSGMTDEEKLQLAPVWLYHQRRQQETKIHFLSYETGT